MFAVCVQSDKQISDSEAVLDLILQLDVLPDPMSIRSGIRRSR
jgi:hypothetical protein